MAKSDPRDRELNRICGWRDGQFIEFVLTDDREDVIINVLVDGDLFATSHQTKDYTDLGTWFRTTEEAENTFSALADRFLVKAVAA